MIDVAITTSKPNGDVAQRRVGTDGPPPNSLRMWAAEIAAGLRKRHG